MSRDLDLMRLHVEALYTQDAAGDLVRVREHGGAPAPRVHLGRAAAGTVCRYRADVGADVRRALDAAVAASSPAAAAWAADPAAAAAAELARYAAVLACEAPVEHTGAGPAFAFPVGPPAPGADAADGVGRPAGEQAASARILPVAPGQEGLLDALLPAWRPDVHHAAPLLAVVADGHAVAVCASVRVTPRAHEAGVETAPGYRRRGYAARVVAAWADAVRALGARPLYSTAWENVASRAVARALGLVPFGHDLHLR